MSCLLAVVVVLEWQQASRSKCNQLQGPAVGLHSHSKRNGLNVAITVKAGAQLHVSPLRSTVVNLESLLAHHAVPVLHEAHVVHVCASRAPRSLQQ